MECKSFVYVSSTFWWRVAVRNFFRLMDCKSLISYTVNPHFLDDHICALLSAPPPSSDLFICAKDLLVEAKAHQFKRPSTVAASRAGRRLPISSPAVQHRLWGLVASPIRERLAASESQQYWGRPRAHK